MSLQDAIGKMKDQITSITGIKGASEYLPDSLPTVDNWVLLYPGNCTFSVAAGQMKELGSVVIELHTPRQADLSYAHQRVAPFFEAIPNCLFDELMDTHFTNKISTFGSISCTGLIAMKYNDIDTVGFRYTVNDVKIETAIT